MKEYFAKDSIRRGVECRCDGFDKICLYHWRRSILRSTIGAFGFIGIFFLMLVLGYAVEMFVVIMSLGILLFIWWFVSIMWNPL